MVDMTIRGAGGTYVTDMSAVRISAAAVSKTDRSGTITTGGVAQTIMSANANRSGWSIYNSSAGDLWVNENGVTAQAGGASFKLIPGALYEDPVNGVSTAAVSVYGATTGQSYSAREW